MIDRCVQEKEVAQVCLLDPLGNGNSNFRHLHYLRDWSGAFIPGYFPFPPLDLLYAATYLKKHGVGVKIIEASVGHLSHKRLVEIIKKNIPDFVVIPSAYFSTEDDKYLSRLIRQSLPSIRAGRLKMWRHSLVSPKDLLIPRVKPRASPSLHWIVFAHSFVAIEATDIRIRLQ